MVWIPDGEKEFDIFSGFDIILASVTQTDILRHLAIVKNLSNA